MMILFLLLRVVVGRLACKCYTSGRCYPQDTAKCWVGDMNAVFNGGTMLMTGCNGKGWHQATWEADCATTANNIHQNAQYNNGPTINCSISLHYSSRSDCEAGTAKLDAIMDDCADVTCSDHGTCIDGIETYTCKCDAGYVGKDCATSTRTLKCNDYFGNGAVFYVEDTATCRVDDMNAAFNEDEKLMAGCTADGRHYAASNVNCRKTRDNINQNTQYNGAPKIKCDAGTDQLFYSSRTDCEAGTAKLDAIMDDCNPNPCNNNAQCTDDADTNFNFKCNCNSGFTGDTCADETTATTTAITTTTAASLTSWEIYQEKVEGKTCNNDQALSYKQGTGCNGWQGITLQQCQEHCTLNDVASGCAAHHGDGVCTAFNYYASTNWCRLYFACDSLVNNDGVVTYIMKDPITTTTFRTTRTTATTTASTTTATTTTVTPYQGDDACAGCMLAYAKNNPRGYIGPDNTGPCMLQGDDSASDPVCALYQDAETQTCPNSYAKCTTSSTTTATTSTTTTVTTTTTTMTTATTPDPCKCVDNVSDRCSDTASPFGCAGNSMSCCRASACPTLAGTTATTATGSTIKWCESGSNAEPDVCQYHHTETLSCSDFCATHLQQSECHSVLDSYYSQVPAFACEKASLKTFDCDTVPAEADAGKFLCRCTSPFESMPFVAKSTTTLATLSTVAATAGQTSSAARENGDGGGSDDGAGDDRTVDSKDALDDVSKDIGAATATTSTSLVDASANADGNEPIDAGSTGTDASSSNGAAVGGAIVGVLLLLAAAFAALVWHRKRAVVSLRYQQHGDGAEIEEGERRRNTVEMSMNPMVVAREAKVNAVVATRMAIGTRAPAAASTTVVNAMYTGPDPTAQLFVIPMEDGSAELPRARKSTVVAAAASGAYKVVGATDATLASGAASAAGIKVAGVKALPAAVSSGYDTGPAACASSSSSQAVGASTIGTIANSPDYVAPDPLQPAKYDAANKASAGCAVYAEPDAAQPAKYSAAKERHKNAAVFDSSDAEYATIDESNYMAYLDAFAGGVKGAIYSELAIFQQIPSSGPIYDAAIDPLSTATVYCAPMSDVTVYATAADAAGVKEAGGRAKISKAKGLNSALYAKASALQLNAGDRDRRLQTLGANSTAAERWEQLANSARAMAAHHSNYDALFAKWARSTWVDDLDMQHQIVVRNIAEALVVQPNPWAGAVTSKKYLLKLLGVYNQTNAGAPVPTIAAACRLIVAKMGGGGAVRFALGEIKKQLRIFEKVLTNDGRFDLIRDYARGVFIVKDVASFPRLLQHLLVDDAFKVVRAKNRLSKNWDSRESAGYRDYQVLVQTKEGWIMELQLIPEAMHTLKATLGHAEYTKYRFIIEAGRRARAVDAEGGSGRAAVDGIDESGV